MTPRWTSPLTGSQVFEADARLVAATLPPGCASLAILDGPYGIKSGLAWDKIPRGGTLADLYQGHLDDVGRVCAASASLYLWNTSAGWAELHPHILARGWTFRSLIVWDKGPAGCKAIFGAEAITEWPDVTEVCAMYQRHGGELAVVEVLAGEMEQERIASGLARATIDTAMGTANVSQYWWQVRNWRLPNEDQWAMLRALAPGWFRAPWEAMRARERAARQARAPFNLPVGGTNVWSTGQVTGPERLKDGNGDTMHPCQKPLIFAERMIRASSRPGDLVWAPFGSTLREMVAAERMARLDPAEARKVVTCELNLDGKDYIGAALEQIGAEVREKAGQLGLFGSAK